MVEEQKNDKTPIVYIVMGCLYGDEGKGTTSEYLTKISNAKYIVRYNGGAQAMHHVVLDDRKTFHCFAQFGSGSFFPGVNTILSRYMFLYPQTLLAEMDHLIECGAKDIENRIFFDKECVLITPLHQLQNRIQETLRGIGSGQYGTTGMGFGITANDAYANFPQFYPQSELFLTNLPKGFKPAVLQIKDLMDKKLLFKKIQQIYEDKIKTVKDMISGKIQVFDQKYVEIHKGQVLVSDESKQKANELFSDFINKHTVDSINHFFSSFAKQFSKNFIDTQTVLEESLSKGENIVFEGAQGCLIDKIYGIYPHITQSLCQAANAVEILKPIKAQYNVIKVGVFRAYSSRHGNGPFVTNSPNWFQSITEDHNQTNKWAGSFRIGPFDVVAANYGLDIFEPDCISITCLDKMILATTKSDEIKEYPICTKYLVNHQEPEVSEVLETKNLFVHQIQNEQCEISQIIKRPPQEVYYNVNLLTVLKDAKPKYEILSNIVSNENSVDKDLQQKVFNNSKQVFKDQYSDEQITQLSLYIAAIQKKLKKPISIISLGPTSNDKFIINDLKPQN